MNPLAEQTRVVLEGFFSTPIAKAIVGACCKAGAKSSLLEDSPEWRGAYHAELTRLLGNYLPDMAKRAQCMEMLTPLRPSAPGELRRSGVRPRVLSSAPTASASTSVEVRDHRDVPNACEVVRDLGRKLGFSRVDQTKMATAVSELARNMLQYAGGGTIRFAEVLAPRRGLEAFFEDRGPGIHDLEQVLDTPGNGLGLRGSRGIADEFTIDTHPGDGTRITMRKYVA